MAIKKKLTKAGTRYYIETRNAGRKVHHPGGYATRREAEAALSRLKVAKLDGVYIAPQTQTVAAYLDSWLASHKGVRPRTRARYKQAIRDHIIPVIGAMR